MPKIEIEVVCGVQFNGKGYAAGERISAEPYDAALLVASGRCRPINEADRATMNAAVQAKVEREHKRADRGRRRPAG